MDGIKNVNNEKPNVEESSNFGVTCEIMRKNMKEFRMVKGIKSRKRQCETMFST